MPESQHREEGDKPCGKKRRICPVFVGSICGFVFAVVCFLLIETAMKPLSSSEYCGTACHEMQTAYDSWKLSGHSVNEKGLKAGCVDCHLPPHHEYFRHIAPCIQARARDVKPRTFSGFKKKGDARYFIPD